MTPGERRHVGLALAAGTLVRVLAAVLTAHRFDAGDGVGYDRIAHNVVAHGVFSIDATSPLSPTAVRPPAYPLFLAALEAIFGASPLPAVVLQIAMTLAAALAVSAVVRKLWPRWALATQWVAMIVPFDALYARTHLSETLCGTTLVCGIALPVLRPEKPTAWMGGGVLFGLCILTRDVYLPALLLLVLGATVLPDMRFGQSRRLPLAFGLVALMTILPWTVRNRVTLGETIPVSKGLMGFNLWVGTWERDAGWVARRGEEMKILPDEAFRSEADRARVAALQELPAAQQDRGFRDLALERIRSAPSATAVGWIKRVRLTWLGTRSDLFDFWPAPLRPQKPLWYAMKAGFYLVNLAVVGLGFLGMILQIRDRRTWWLAATVWVNLAVYVPFHNTETRYSQPVYLLVLAFAVVTAGMLVERALAWRRSAPISVTGPERGA